MNTRGFRNDGVYDGKLTGLRRLARRRRLGRFRRRFPVPGILFIVKKCPKGHFCGSVERAGSGVGDSERKTERERASERESEIERERGAGGGKWEWGK
jgi:hypothetical protein